MHNPGFLSSLHQATLQPTCVQARRIWLVRSPQAPGLVAFRVQVSPSQGTFSSRF